MLFHHLCIQTNNYEKSLAFYKDILGFNLVNETKNFHERQYNTWLQLKDVYIELQTGKKNLQLAAFNKETQGLAHLCFYVEDLQQMRTKLEKQGVHFLKKKGQAIYYVEGGALFKVQAPEGTIIEFRDNPII
ncbi:VOC family protein [Erwinia sp. CPCC 100877]|nr:VOC family protein [Erwinia sp. CPCC 100877]